MSLFALVDCNNFFVSCERVFQPELEGRAVVVLSGNDGCVISRSEEAKTIGIGMAVPFHEVRSLVAEHRVVALSANHELYVDMSRRVAEVLKRHSPEVEGYSIDESFLSWTNDDRVLARAWTLRTEVGRWTGIPVSVGLGPTKALAKLASDKAKKADGVLSLIDPEFREKILSETPVQHVWGIARASAEKLAAHGARTAAEFADLSDSTLQKTLGIGGVRLAQELRGISCLTLAHAAPARQSITVSRTFGRPVGNLAGLENALSSFMVQAAERARRHGLKAGAVRVFLGWREDGALRGDDAVERIIPTDDTASLLRIGKKIGERLFVEGRSYRKAGVILGALEQADSGQGEFFYDGRATRSRVLSKTVDRLNASLGPGTLLYGAAAMKRSWTPRSDHRSPRWTTAWEELPKIKF